MTGADRERVLAALREAPERIARLIFGLDRSAARFRPPGAEFSVVGNVCHLKDIETEGFTLRIERLLRENAPLLPDLDGAKLAAGRAYDTRDPGAELVAFRAARQRSLALVAHLAPGSEAWRREGTLEGVGPITLDGLIRRMADHDRGHIEEIGRIAGAAGEGVFPEGGGNPEGEAT